LLVRLFQKHGLKRLLGKTCELQTQKLFCHYTYLEYHIRNVCAKGNSEIFSTDLIAKMS